ncbi:hypothetical protein HYT18_03535, partial [Candidatus Microgenomates bacterium]|nr:hypothetical protein [Candidatus Microgenomates bacterium]
MPTSQKGLAPILLILLAALGIILFILIASSATFRDRLFSQLFPKPTPHAQEPAPQVPDEILLKFKSGVADKIK